MSAPPAILIVDDVEENLIALEALLHDPRRRLFRAASGREALELLLQESFAIALIDVHMPEMDGFELAELMRGTERTSNVPIVFVTANYDDPHRVFQGYDAGAVDFLIKPIEPRILLQKVETFVQLFEHRRRQADQLAELERVSGQLAETLRIHELFVASVGHDLRGPLTAIHTAAELLGEMVREPSAINAVDRITASTRRMVGVIDELYDLSRVRLGDGVALHRETVDLGAVVREVASELRSGRTSPIEVRVEGDATGPWDAVRLARVTGNLLANALEHGVPGRPIIAHVDGHHTDRVSLRISNEGAIPVDVQATIFEPFRSGRGRRSGLGLGLYIVREVVNAHGGTIVVESAPDRGTTFAVELPRSG